MKPAPVVYGPVKYIRRNGNENNWCALLMTKGEHVTLKRAS